MKSVIRIITLIIVVGMGVEDCAFAQDTAEKDVEDPLKQANAAAIEVKKQAETALENDIPLLRLLQANQQTGGRPILVIPTAKMEVGDLAKITEDLNIMARIVDKKLKRQLFLGEGGTIIIGGLLAHGRHTPLLSGDDRFTKALYVQGYGAIFLVKVDFPLSPPPEIKVDESKESIDPFWEQTKREIQAAGQGSARHKTGRGDIADIGSLTSLGAQEPYDADKVEELQRNMIKTLKHAANIQNLKPDEWVVVVVRGASTFAAVEIVRTESGADKITTVTPIIRKTDSASSTVLTICAKKSDVDAFSKGTLHIDEFRKKAKIFKYQHLEDRAGHPRYILEPARLK